MSGSLAIIGLGPGDPALLPPRAQAALEAATDLMGYASYLDRVPPRPGQRRHASDNRMELARARQALACAAAGGRVGLVSGGDPGVFGMASAVFEVVAAEPGFAAIDIEVVPGISALLAAAARLGAPLGHDFCAISLSDNLKPWDTVLQRLRAAATAGFVLALYNVRSAARPWQLGAALTALREKLPPDTQVAFATAISRPDEQVTISCLADADPAGADMRTLVLVGSAATRAIARPAGVPWLYTPRSAA